jgi:hypothetical protein
VALVAAAVMRALAGPVLAPAARQLDMQLIFRI